jgi:hypothetical protein
VPRERLPQAESALMLAGWHATGLSEYDKRYYRRWMHEIPPMQHIQRATVIDVHHAILPDTARYHPDSAKLRSRAVAVEGLPGIYVLATEDRILHSATHLFHDGELPHGLRDLTDPDLLLRDGSRSRLLPRLTARADELHRAAAVLRPALFAPFSRYAGPASVMAVLTPPRPTRHARPDGPRLYPRTAPRTPVAPMPSLRPPGRLVRAHRCACPRISAAALVPQGLHQPLPGQSHSQTGLTPIALCV